jgi:pentatricopeptide repeat protein
VNARHPDFKHKRTQESLWVEDQWNPPWVEAEIAAMAPGTVQLNIFSWNKRLARCVKAGQYEKTIELFQQLQQEGVSPDKFTFVPVLNACANLRALQQGRCVHEQIIQSGCQSDVFLGSSLTNMYVKCGRLEDAWRVFNKMPSHDIVSWNVMIVGHVKTGKAQKALELFQQMQQEGAWRMLGECSIGCHCATWSLGHRCSWDMSKVGKGRRPWNYINKCNWKVFSQTLSHL